VAHRVGRLFEDLLAGATQLVLQVDVGGGDEGVNDGSLGVLEGLPGTVDVPSSGAGEARYRRGADPLGYRANRLEIPLGGDWETGLDDVHAELLELLGHLHLLVQVQAETGRLLTISQRGVEDPDQIGH
jgi:hypothetical protein